MRFYSVRQKEIILTSNGKPIALMAGVDEENIEKDKLTDKEIDLEIIAVRRERIS